MQNKKNVLDYFNEMEKMLGTRKLNQALGEKNSPLTKYMRQKQAESNSNATEQQPELIRKTSIYDDDAEELTPAGEAAFREGFASASDRDDNAEALERIRAAVKDAKKKQEKVEFLGELPLDRKSYNSGTYKYVDRELTAAQNRHNYLNKETGKYNFKPPAGQFGIALTNEPDIIAPYGKNQVNYVLGLDTKRVSKTGRIYPITAPKWKFNEDAIKQHNNQRIDNFIDAIMKVTPESKRAKLSAAADAAKNQQAIRVDKEVKRMEGILNPNGKSGFKNKANRYFSEAVESIPKIADSKAGKLLKTGGKAVSVAGDVIQIADTAIDIYDDYKDDGKLGKKTVKELVGVAGDFGGAALGAKAGAALLGTIFGVASGGVLAAPAAMIGGIVGGIIGGFAGESLAEGAFELFT